MWRDKGPALFKSFSFLCFGSLLITLALLPARILAQDFDWIRRFGTDRDDQANAVAQASSGIYAAGRTIGIFPGEPSAGMNDIDAFVIRFDTFGNQIWLRQFGSSTVAVDVANGVVADATGVYVVGRTDGTLPEQESSGSADVFVRKYDVDGNVLWTRQFGSAYDDEAWGVAIAAGGIFVGGTVQGPLPGQEGFNANADAFVRMYDPDGNELWTRQFGTGSVEEAYGIAADDSGVYITGRTNGNLGGDARGFDIFLRKYDAEGNEGWTRQFGTDTTDQGNAVAVDSSGVYVAGDTVGAFAGQEKIGGLWDEFVARFDLDGEQLWVRQFGTVAEDGASGIAVNFDGVFVVGFNDGEALPGEEALGGWDAFVRIYDFEGNVTATRQFGTSNNDWAYGVAADDSGAYICGYFSGNAEGQAPLGGNDAFLLKIPGQPALSFAQFVTGMLDVPNRTRVILINNSDEADSGLLQFLDNHGELTLVSIGGVLTDSVAYNLGPWSTTEVLTDGTEATLKSGIIALQSNRGTESRVEGTEAFEVLGNFVSVASSPLRSSGQLYVSVTDAEDTGVALYNPGKQNSITVKVSLSDSSDQLQAERDVILAPGVQLVTFVDQAELFADFFESLEGDFQGRLRLAAEDDREFALLVLLQKKVNGALIATSAEAAGDPGRLIFTQFADGVVESQQGPIPNRTRIILINDGDQTDTGSIGFQNASGTPTPVPIQGTPTETLPYSLEAGNTAEVETDGTGVLQSGVIEVNSALEADSKILASEVFEILGHFVSVNHSPPRNRQQAYVSVTDEEDTGVALYNPDPENALTLTLILVNSGGLEETRKEVVLGPGQQLVRYVDQEELFADFLAEREGDFTGTLNILAEEGRAASVLGLLQIRATGALIAVATSPNAFGNIQ